MHPAAMTYIVGAAEKYDLQRYRLKAVEFGACDVNGHARAAFPKATWYGVDLRPGPNVDEVVDAADFKGKDYDLVLSAEMLEHAPNGKAVLENAFKVLRPGGYLIATMAAPERHPHNNDGDHHNFAPGEHYEGVSKEVLARWLWWWNVKEIIHSPNDGDLYVTARKPR